MKNLKPRGDEMKASPPAIILVDANKIVPIQTREDRREGLRRNIDPKRYTNPNTPDGKWPRHIV